MILHTEFIWRVGVHFEQNATKNNDLFKKCFQQKVFRIKFIQKSQWTHICISLRNEARGLQRLTFLKYFNALEWESRFTLGQNATKNTKDIKKMLQTKIVQN